MNLLNSRPESENPYGVHYILDGHFCFNLGCTYEVAHLHGYACTSGCPCNRHGRVD